MVAYDEVVKQLRQMVEADPSDLRTQLRLADLEHRNGNVAEAVRIYEHVADRYLEQKHTLQAITVLQQVLKLEPERTSARTKLEQAEAMFRSQVGN